MECKTFCDILFSGNYVKGVPIMLFYKVLILFWGCTRTCSHPWWFENRIIFHIIYLITYYGLYLILLGITIFIGQINYRPGENDVICIAPINK